MTEEQKRARKESAERGHIKWLIDNCLIKETDPRDVEDDFVFISYKSDDYERVLDEIVYDTCRKYGLRIYFDVKFDEQSDLWIKQFYGFMGSTHCKAFIAFIDDAYYASYATLMEMMARKTRSAGGDFEMDSLFYIPVNLGSLTGMSKGVNTGLGTYRFSNGVINTHAADELRMFDRLFRELADQDNSLRYLYDDGRDEPNRYDEGNLYCEKVVNPETGEVISGYSKHGMFLQVKQCQKIMSKVIPSSNDNDGTNKNYAEAIHDKLVNMYPSVFIPEWKPQNIDVLQTNTDAENVGTVQGAEEGSAVRVGSDSISGPRKLYSGSALSGVHASLKDALAEHYAGTWRYVTRKGADAAILWDNTGKSCTVLKGSRAAKEADKFATAVPGAKLLKDELIQKGILVDDVFRSDFHFNKIATMINLLCGGSVSMPAEIKAGNLYPTGQAGEAAQEPQEKTMQKYDGQIDAGMEESLHMPQALETDFCVAEAVYRYKGARIKCALSAKQCTVMKGSRLQDESPKFATNASGAKKLKEQLMTEGIIDNGVFVSDYRGSMATLLNLINGGSVSAPREKEKFVKEA